MVKAAMGMKKHARSGKNPKSPKVRHAMKREAESNKKILKRTTIFCSFSELMKNGV